MTNNRNTYPEITIKAIILGILLSALLAGANAYLGLLPLLLEPYVTYFHQNELLL